MQQALKGVPVAEPTVPPGVVNVGGEWFYEEYARNAASPAWAWTARPRAPPPPAPTPAPEERNRILDLFRN
jgi:penicillin-binding protein 1A